MAGRSFDTAGIGGGMIDLSNIRYRVVVMDEAGNQYNIKDFIQNLGWEENEKEISVHS